MRAGGAEQVAQPRTVGEFDVLLAEIELQLQQGSELQELLPQAAQLRGIAAAQLVHRHAVLRRGRRGDHVRNRFCLRQIHLAVDIRAAREFARLGEPAARLRQFVQQGADDVGGGVAADLRGVLARIRARRAENAHEDVVQPGGVAELDGIALGRGRRPGAERDHAVHGGQRVGSADADDGDGARAGGSGRRTDGISSVYHTCEYTNYRRIYAPALC